MDGMALITVQGFDNVGKRGCLVKQEDGTPSLPYGKCYVHVDMWFVINIFMMLNYPQLEQ